MSIWGRNLPRWRSDRLQAYSEGHGGLLRGGRLRDYLARYSLSKRTLLQSKQPQKSRAMRGFLGSHAIVRTTRYREHVGQALNAWHIFTINPGAHHLSEVISPANRNIIDIYIDFISRLIFGEFQGNLGILPGSKLRSKPIKDAIAVLTL